MTANWFVAQQVMKTPVANTVHGKVSSQTADRLSSVDGGTKPPGIYEGPNGSPCRFIP